MNKEQYRELTMYSQYQIPRKLFYLAERFPHVTFVNAIKLYELAVEEIRIIYNIENSVTDLPFGQGLELARDKWLEKMGEAENTSK